MSAQILMMNMRDIPLSFYSWCVSKASQWFPGEAGVPFIFASGSEFEEIWVGVGATRVRELMGESSLSLSYNLSILFLSILSPLSCGVFLSFSLCLSQWIDFDKYFSNIEKT